MDAHAQNADEKSWQGQRPGEKQGDAASSDNRAEPGKYKGFWQRFSKEVQEKSKSK